MDNLSRFKNSKLDRLSSDDNSLFILYPTDGYYLTEEQFNSVLVPLMNTTKSSKIYIQDTEFDVSSKVNGDLGSELRVWSLDEFYFNKYSDLLLLFENTIYVEDHSWSITIFQDFFGLLILEKEIGELLIKNYNFEHDKKKLVEFINSSSVSNEIFRNELLEVICKAVWCQWRYKSKQPEIRLSFFWPELCDLNRIFLLNK